MITDSFDKNSESVISLSDFYDKSDVQVKKCLIIFSKVIYKELKRRFRVKKIACIKSCREDIPVYCFLYRKERIAFYLSNIGSTSAATEMNEVNYMIGATSFIMFGSCGSLDSNKTKNRFIIPSSAYRDEGLSYHYMENSDYIEIKNCKQVSLIFEKYKIPYVVGKVWTTDAFLRETKNQVKLRKKEGCIAVEMELAGVQAVADYYNFQLFNFLQAGDVIEDNDYSNEKLSNANHDLIKLNIALLIAENI